MIKMEYVKNEIPKEQLLIIDYNWTTVGNTWFFNYILFPIIEQALIWDNNDSNTVENATIADIVTAADNILCEKKDPETELEISFYNLVKKHLEEHPVRN
jgi:hypothetical protein